MMVIHVPPEELKEASIIGKSANLAGIQLRAVVVDQTGIELFFDQNDKSEINMNINYNCKMKELVSGKFVSSLVAVDVKLTKKESLLRFMVEYQVTYKLPDAAIPKHLTEKMFEAFARHNGLLNCWPYIRAQINNLSSEVGVPVMLPLMKISAVETPIPVSEGHVQSEKS